MSQVIWYRVTQLTSFIRTVVVLREIFRNSLKYFQKKNVKSRSEILNANIGKHFNPVTTYVARLLKARIIKPADSC
jgi:hypothetical protein